MTPAEIGRIIRVRRRELGLHVEASRNQRGEWTGDGLKEITGYAAGTIRRVERGDPVRLSVLLDVCDALGLSVVVVCGSNIDLD